MEAKKGDVIKTKKYGYIGTVVHVDDHFAGDMAWYKMQKNPAPIESLSKPWYRVLTEPQGSVYVPESLQGSERGESMTEALDCLESAVNGLEDVISSLNEL